jgi:hypothetical protein
MDIDHFAEGEDAVDDRLQGASGLRRYARIT